MTDEPRLQWLIEGEPWLSFRAAIEMIRGSRSVSVGKGQVILRTLVASGEVRSQYAPTNKVLLTADDGVMSMDLHPGAVNKGAPSVEEIRERCFSRDDLTYSLNLMVPPQQQAQASPVAGSPDDRWPIPTQEPRGLVQATAWREIKARWGSEGGPPRSLSFPDIAAVINKQIFKKGGRGVSPDTVNRLLQRK